MTTKTLPSIEKDGDDVCPLRFTRTIVIFGAPGAGKTTQIAELAALADGVDSGAKFAFLHEPTKDEQARKLLAALYSPKPPASAVYDLQTYVLSERARQYRAMAQRCAHVPRTYLFVDGHVATDYSLYACPAIHSGKMSAAESAAYEEAYAAALSGPDAAPPWIIRPWCFIYLRLPPPIAAHRVAERDNVEERGVDESLFAALARRADRVAKKLGQLGLTVHTIDAEQPPLDVTCAILDLLQNQAENHNK